MKERTIKEELIWHLKNAWTKKKSVLPFLAPCYLGWFLWNYIGCFLDDFIETVKFKTQEERDAFIEKKNAEYEEYKQKRQFAVYAFMSSAIYMQLFGFTKAMTGLQFLNLPTYLLVALPYETIHQIILIPVHYNIPGISQ